jgi:tetratricopeptide (TPR) repeat protein
MTLFLLVLAQAAAAAPPSPKSAAEKEFAACVKLVDSKPEEAIITANEWRLRGGAVLARQCLGLAYAAQGRWTPAATAFEQAASEAQAAADGRSGPLWVQAGNAALAGGDAAKARSHFTSALVAGQIKGIDAGELHLDLARADFALGDKAGARKDLDTALRLVPQDPLAWLLSATLARRSGDLDRAGADIAEAAKRSPDDASVALEAGNIAVLAGANTAARTAWSAAVKLAPQSDAGKAAAASLKQLGN